MTQEERNEYNRIRREINNLVVKNGYNDSKAAKVVIGMNK